MWDKLVGAELYEHSNDPVSETAPPRACDWDYEAINLANVAAHSATRETLSRLLHEGWRSALPQIDGNRTQPRPQLVRIQLPSVTADRKSGSMTLRDTSRL